MADFGDFSLITVITNSGGMGPGHSAIAINQTVYSVELGNINPNKSAWLVIALERYKSHVNNRPLIYQNLNSKVSMSRTMDYIRKSDQRDDDYFTNGVCSSQAGSAIEAGLGPGNTFNAQWGFDSPFSIFELAYQREIVASTHFEWPGEQACSQQMRDNIGLRIENWYRSYFSNHGVTGAKESYWPAARARRSGPSVGPQPGQAGPRRHGRVSAYH